MKASEIMATVYPPVSWVVKKLIPVNSINVLAGASSAGKSRLAYDIVSAVLVDGGSWLGHTNGLGRAGRVLYIDMEHSEPEIQERLAPLKLPPDALERLIFEHVAGIATKDERLAFKAIVERTLPDLVVLDPLLFIHGFAPSKDVSNNVEVAESMKLILEIAHRPGGPAFLLVTYLNKTAIRSDNMKAGLDMDSDEASTAVLGATALFASCNTRIVLYAGRGGHRKITMGGKRLRWVTIRVVLDDETGRYRWPAKGESPDNQSYREWLGSVERDVPIPGKTPTTGWPGGQLVTR